MSINFSYLQRHVVDLDLVAVPLAEELDLGHLSHDGRGLLHGHGGILVVRLGHLEQVGQEG